MTSMALTQEFNTLPATLSPDSVDAYITQVGNTAILSAEEEKELAVRLHEHNDLEAARLLVMSHLRFVIHIARGYSGYGLPLADLIQEGNVGLMKAVKRLDPGVGVRLVSFAVHWIRAEIHEFIIRNWRIVKVATTKAQRKLFFKLRGAKKRLGWLNHNEVETVASELGVPAKTVLEMEARLTGMDLGYDAGDISDDSETPYAPAQYLAAPNADPSSQAEHDDWNAQNIDKLNLALGALDNRSKDIVISRWLNDENKATLHELADRYGVSAERIRQLEVNAIKKLRSSLMG